VGTSTLHSFCWARSWSGTQGLITSIQMMSAFDYINPRFEESQEEGAHYLYIWVHLMISKKSLGRLWVTKRGSKKTTTFGTKHVSVFWTVPDTPNNHFMIWQNDILEWSWFPSFGKREITAPPKKLKDLDLASFYWLWSPLPLRLVKNLQKAGWGTSRSSLMQNNINSARG